MTKQSLSAITACVLLCLLAPGCGNDEPQRTQHESVDLGLSVKWSTTNIGAQNPENHGTLFGWADSTGRHQTFDKISIMYRPESDGSETTVVNWKSAYYGGQTPPSDISATKYDIALYQWGDDWRMPTLDEWQELVERCTWTTTTVGATPAYRVTGPNGKSIILPMTGSRQSDGSVQLRDATAYYWTSTLLPLASQTAHHYESNVACAAWCVRFNPSATPMITTGLRCYGMAVRPVAAK